MTATDETAESILAGPFVELADALFAVPEGAGVLGVVERVAAAARAIVTGADVVSVGLRGPDGEFATVAATDRAATLADDVQTQEGEGPGLTAAERTGIGAAGHGDLGPGCPWPRYGRRVADELGLHAVLATGMFPGGEPPRFGALTFYSWTPAGLDQADQDHALLLAAHAATAIAAVKVRTAAELRESQFTAALRSRDVIGQAKGILMERRGYTADEAFEVLRRTSQDLNVKLREVAETLVTRRTEL